VVFRQRPKRWHFFFYGAYMRFLSRPSSSVLRRFSAALALSALLSPAFALPVMEMRAEDYLPMASELKKSLSLNANQQTLWAQTESKTRNLLRDRKARREQLQAATLAGAQGASVELRELAKAIDQETTISAAEEKQLREWWLTVNDALSESQRQTVAQTLAEQLQRVPDNGGGARSERKEEGGGEHRGGKGGGRGGMGGGGMGMGVGAGGVNVNLPGSGG
jgi:multidrug efflux pump subunit AcrB